MRKATAVTLPPAPSSLMVPGIDLPPGETGTELEGGAAIVALRDRMAYKQNSSVPRVKLTLVNLDVHREDKTVIVKASFGKVETLTIRLSMFWARTLWLKLGKALGK